jgi:hypothetical protein
MPASITARSSSTLASSRAMRLKPTLTSRISLVSVFSSSTESKSPSRMRLAAKLSCRSGWLIRRAMAIEPTSVAISAMPTHTNQVPGVSGSTRAASACSQYESFSIVKPTHRPGWPLTVRASTVLGSRRERRSAPTMRVKRSISNGSQRSPGSRGSTRIASWSVMVLTTATRLMPSV